MWPLLWGREPSTLLPLYDWASCGLYGGWCHHQCSFKLLSLSEVSQEGISVAICTLNTVVEPSRIYEKHHEQKDLEPQFCICAPCLDCSCLLVIFTGHSAKLGQVYYCQCLNQAYSYGMATESSYSKLTKLMYAFFYFPGAVTVIFNKLMATATKFILELHPWILQLQWAQRTRQHVDTEEARTVQSCDNVITMVTMLLWLYVVILYLILCWPLWFLIII